MIPIIPKHTGNVLILNIIIHVLIYVVLLWHKKQEHLGSAIYLEKIYSFHSIRPERERERERDSSFRVVDLFSLTIIKYELKTTQAFLPLCHYASLWRAVVE